MARLLLAGLESVALDLGRAGARSVLADLVARADVLVESFRPGTLARWGLGPEALRRRHPRLVICSLSGWGQEGPGSARAGHDLTYAAVAGMLASTAAMPPLLVADHLGAWGAAASILAALLAREASGEGAWIDAALVDAAGHASLTALAAEAAGPRVLGERLPLTGGIAGYDIYATRDGGRVAIAALEPHYWAGLCEATGRPDLLELQYRGDAASRARVAEWVAGRSRAEWQALFAELDCAADPVLTLAEARAEPRVAARGLVREHPAGASGRETRLAFPTRFDGVRPGGGGEVAAVGAHTRALLEELGRAEAGLDDDALGELGIGPAGS